MFGSDFMRSFGVVVTIVALSGPFLLSSSGEEKRVSIYSVVANYTLPVTEHNDQDYVGLLEALDPLGSVKAIPDGKRWRLRYENVECEFVPGSSQARIGRHKFDLHANFVLENGR